MSEIKLKPCPFCGNKPVTAVKVVPGKTTDYIRFKVICYKCHTEKYIDIQSGYINFKEVEEATQEVVEAWNRRTDNEIN